MYPNVCFLQIHVERIFVERHHFLRIFYNFFFFIIDDTERVKFVAKCGNSFFHSHLISFSPRVPLQILVSEMIRVHGSENFSLSEFESNIVIL